MTPKLKQQTISFVARFFTINRKKLLNDLLKIDPSLRNLKGKLLLDIVLYGFDKNKWEPQVFIHLTGWSNELN